MTDEIRLDPAAARAKFGELLTDGPVKTHKHFERPKGVWRPEFDNTAGLTGYRLHPKVVPFRPKRR